MAAATLAFIDLGVGERILEAVGDAVVFVAKSMLKGAIGIGDFVWQLSKTATNIDLLDTLNDDYHALSLIALTCLIGAGFAGITLSAMQGKPSDGLRRLFVDGPIGIAVMTTGLQLAAYFLVAVADVESLVIGLGNGDGPFAGLSAVTEIEGDVAVVAAFPMMFLSVFIVLVSILLGLFFMIRIAGLSVMALFIPFVAAMRPSSYGSMLRLHIERFVMLAVSSVVILVAMRAGTLIMNTAVDVSDVYFLSPAPTEPGAAVDTAPTEPAADTAAVATILGSMFVALGILVVAAASPWLVLSVIPGAHHDGSPLSGGDGGAIFSPKPAPVQPPPATLAVEFCAATSPRPRPTP